VLYHNLNGYIDRARICSDALTTSEFMSLETITDIPVEAHVVITGLENVCPNPFNPLTSISFSVDRPQRVSISVFDMTGKRVATVSNEVYGAGSHTVEWNGKDSSGRAVSSGAYLVRMETEGQAESKKIMLVR